MLDDHHGSALLHEALQHGDERGHVQRVQPDGGLVEDEEGVALVAAHLAGQLQALGLAAGKRRGGLAQGEIAQAQIAQGFQFGAHLLLGRERCGGLVYGERQQLGQRQGGYGVEVVGAAGCARVGAFRGGGAGNCVGPAFGTAAWVVVNSHLDGVGGSAVAAAAAVGAGDVHIGKELHVQGDLPRAVAGGAAQRPGVVGEIAGLEPRSLGLGQLRESAA